VPLTSSDLIPQFEEEELSAVGNRYKSRENVSECRACETAITVALILIINV
jgi:hypothetical protein